MKRLFAFMMALALVLSLSVTAFAAGGNNGTITISNAAVGSTYSVYKIFDATYNDNGDVTYTITTENPFFDDMFGAEGTAGDYFVYHAATGVVTRKTDEDGKYVKTDAQLFEYLQNLVKNADTTITATKTAENQEIKFTNLATGYYVIKSENADKAVAVTITTAKPDAVVNDKNNLPGGDFDKKFTNGTDGTANVGDVIYWELFFTATNFSKEEKVVRYTIKDNLNPAGWAEIDLRSIVITVDGEPLEKDTEWKLISGDANGFEIQIPWVDANEEFLYDPTVEVKVNYNATVLEEAADNSTNNKNEAKLEWTLDTGVTPPGSGDETETEVFNVGFTKVDGTNPTKTLAGAEFELYGAYNDETKEYSNPIMVSGSDGVYVVDPNGPSNKVQTPEGGAVVIKGLEQGTYYLKETVAPAGYNKLTDPVVVTIVPDVVDENGNVTKPNGSTINVGGTPYYVNHAAINVENFSGVELPSTGGKGTMMMITIGTMVAMAFAVLMITQKKMSIYQD